MTNYEIEQQKRIMSCGWKNGRYIKGTPQEEKRLEEFDCISMINSLLVYGNLGLSGEDLIERQENSRHNYLLDYIKKLGKRKVVKLIEEQNKSIKFIEYGGTDGEGNSYNSIQWQ